MPCTNLPFITWQPPFSLTSSGTDSDQEGITDQPTEVELSVPCEVDIVHTNFPHKLHHVLFLGAANMEGCSDSEMDTDASEPGKKATL